MKNLIVASCVYVLAGTLFSSALLAQYNGNGGLGTNAPSYSRSGISSAAAEGLEPSRPDSLTITTPQTSTEYAVSSLLSSIPQNAGAPTQDPKDAKSLVAPSTADTSEDGFSEPAAYLEYKFTQVQDDRPLGFDGPQHSGIVGFDFDSYFKTIVGFNFTYANANLQSTASFAPGTLFLNSSNSYFMSPYIARNFYDWINVGGSLTYGRTDTDFQANGPGVAAADQDTTQDSFAISPFIGVAHTFGAFSFSSTPSYIWNYDHFSFDNPIPNTGGPAPGDAKTLNQEFLWLNNFQYAATDKLSLSIQVNWTRLLTIQNVATSTVTPAIPSQGHQWMSFGARADYSVTRDAAVFAAFEHDALSTTFDDYRIRTGVTYNF